MEFSLLLAIKVLFAFTLQSDIPTGQYIDFSGDIGGTTAIQASLFIFPDHTVKGAYFYDLRGQADQAKRPFYRMNLEGQVKDGKFDLKESDMGGRHLGQFVGQFGTDEGAELSFSGTHHDLFGGKDRNFYLSGNVQSGDTEYDHRYAPAETQLHDNEVEFFAHLLQTTLLKKKAEPFLKMVSYPLLLQSNSGKKKKIKNETQLRERFAEIFNGNAHNLLLNASHSAMPVTDEGIVLAGFIYLRPNEKRGLSVYKIAQK